MSPVFRVNTVPGSARAARYFIIIIVIIIISFMQGVYTYIPETNNVPREYIVAAILYYYYYYYYCSLLLLLLLTTNRLSLISHKLEVFKYGINFSGKTYVVIL
jgi:hypothetical protein